MERARTSDILRADREDSTVKRLENSRREVDESNDGVFLGLNFEFCSQSFVNYLFEGFLLSVRIFLNRIDL